MEDLKCPVCKHELSIKDNGDYRCPNCFRHWTYDGIDKYKNLENWSKNK